MLFGNLMLGSMPSLVKGEEQNSITAPASYVPELVTEPIILGSEKLIIVDAWPWGSHAVEIVLNERGETYDIIPTSSLAAWDLSGYRVVIVSSTQWTWSYDNIITSKDKLAAYVASGGVLIAHACDLGWDGSGHWYSSFLPGGVYHADYMYPDWDWGALDDTPHISMPTHPIVTAPNPIPESSLWNWGSSTHGYLTNLLPSTDVIIQDSEGRPIYIEYRWGAGLVLATMMTMEWWLANWNLLRNEIAYAQSWTPRFLEKNLSPTSGSLGTLVHIKLNVGVSELETPYTPPTLSGTVLSVEPPSLIDISLVPGSTFDILINITNVNNLYGFEFKLGYATSVLTATGITLGPFFPPNSAEWINLIDDTASYAWYSLTLPLGTPPELSLDGNGTIAIISFSVDNFGVSKLDLRDVLMADGYANPITPNIRDGYFANVAIPPPVTLATVEDTLPPELSYIQGTFKVNDASATPKVTTTPPPPPKSQVISYNLTAAGNYMIEFDAKVTKAYWEDRTVTNKATATWYNDVGNVIETKEDVEHFIIQPFKFKKEIISGFLVENGGFESGISPWVVGGFGDHIVTGEDFKSGTNSLLIGYKYNPNVAFDKDFAYQTIMIPATASNVRFSFNYHLFTEDSVSYNWLEVYIRDTAGNNLALVFQKGGIDYPGLEEYGWEQVTFDLSSYAGQTIQLYFAVANWWDTLFRTWAFIDDVSVVYETLTIKEKTNVQWSLEIRVTNPFSYTMTNVVVTDRFGAEIEFDPSFPFSITHGVASYYMHGASDKLFLTWNVGNLLPGQTAQLITLVSTDTNPGRGDCNKDGTVNLQDAILLTTSFGTATYPYADFDKSGTVDIFDAITLSGHYGEMFSGKQEYTTPGIYELNSGATLKFIDPDQNIQLSAVTAPIYVTVLPLEDP